MRFTNFATTIAETCARLAGQELTFALLPERERELIACARGTDQK